MNEENQDKSTEDVNTTNSVNKPQEPSENFQENQSTVSQNQVSVSQSPQTVLPTTAAADTNSQNMQTNSSVNSASNNPQTTVQSKADGGKARGKKKLLLPILAGVLLLLGGVAAAYNAVVLNSPEGVWNRALLTTSRGLEAILSEATTEPAKGGTMEGSFKVESPTVADGTISGGWYESTVSMDANVGVAGIRPKTEIRAIPPNSETLPDIYVKVTDLNGLSGLLSGFNPALAELINEIDGSWYMIDHTLYEQALQSESEGSIPELTPEELNQIAENVRTVLNERLFTDNEETAVVIVEEELGREDFEGVDTYKYKLRVQKEQLKDFAVALKDSLKGTAIQDILLSDTQGQTIEEVLDFDQLLSDIENTDFSNATAEAWVDAERKFIRNIRITPATEFSENETGYIDFYLPYNGGDVFPFTLKVFYENSEDGTKTDVEAVMAINRENDELELSLDINANDSVQDIIANARLKITPSDEQITVETPENAKNIFELVGLFFGMNGLNDPTQPQPFIEDDLPSDTLGDFDIRDLLGGSSNDNATEAVEL